MGKFINFIKNKFKYKPKAAYDFDIEESNNIPNNDLSNAEPKNIFEKLRKQFEFFKI